MLSEMPGQRIPRQGSVLASQNDILRNIDVVASVITDYPSQVCDSGDVGYLPTNICYPNDRVGRFCQDAAMLINANTIGTQIIYGGVGGFDTHSSQASSHSNRLVEIDNALGMLVNDLKRLGRWDETVICIFTEFGRKTFENGSGGTDHGWGGAIVMLGGGVRGGVYGSTPSDAEIRNSNWLAMDIDFRNAFSEVISWLGFNPSPVFPESYVKTNLGVL